MKSINPNWNLPIILSVRKMGGGGGVKEGDLNGKDTVGLNS